MNSFRRCYYVCFLAIGAISLTQFAGAQTRLAPNKPETLMLRGGDSREFTIDLKSGDFAEFSWLANDALDVELKFLAPNGTNLLEHLQVTDTIPVVVPEHGVYRLQIKLNKESADGESEIAGVHRLTIQYSDRFVLPRGSVVKSTRRVNGYEAKVIETKGEPAYSYFIIEKDGKLKTLLKGDKFVAAGFYFPDDLSHAYNSTERKSAAFFRAALDKTGEGTPDVAIEYYSGGAHCCFYLHFFELGTSVRVIEPLSTADARTVAIGRTPKNALRLETGDATFRYWNIPFAGSPMPSVILEYSGNHFRPNFAAMKRKSPSLSALQLKARRARAKMNSKAYIGDSFAGLDDSGYIFEEAFWGEMLDLIYSGNESLAWQYFDLVWKVDKPGKETFRKDFLDRLNESIFWQAITEDSRNDK